MCAGVGLGALVAVGLFGCASRRDQALGAAHPTETLVETDGGADAGACSGDADCRIVSNYCRPTPCSCTPLRVGEELTCTSTLVQCLVDPCRGKVARCRAGACVAEDSGPAQ